MTKCSTCKKQIRFIRSKKDGTKIAVNAEMIFFLPPNGCDKEEVFINADGYEVKGCRASGDGKTGYKRHECI